MSLRKIYVILVEYGMKLTLLCSVREITQIIKYKKCIILESSRELANGVFPTLIYILFQLRPFLCYYTFPTAVFVPHSI